MSPDPRTALAGAATQPSTGNRTAVVLSPNCHLLPTCRCQLPMVASQWLTGRAWQRQVFSTCSTKPRCSSRNQPPHNHLCSPTLQCCLPIMGVRRSQSKGLKRTPQSGGRPLPPSLWVTRGLPWSMLVTGVNCLYWKLATPSRQVPRSSPSAKLCRQQARLLRGHVLRGGRVGHDGH